MARGVRRPDRSRTGSACRRGRGHRGRYSLTLEATHDLGPVDGPAPAPLRLLADHDPALLGAPELALERLTHEGLLVGMTMVVNMRRTRSSRGRLAITGANAALMRPASSANSWSVSSSGTWR